MDKTIINILTLLLSGSGFFIALTKFNVPQINQTFFGTNPFLIKRDKIDSVMTWTFTLLAMVGLLLQLYVEVFGANMPSRIYSVCFYVIFAIMTSLVVAIIIYFLTKIGRVIARKISQPLLVESQREIFKITKFVIENGGWKKEQLPHKDTYNNPNRYIEENFTMANRRIQQLENLLDIKCGDSTLKQRVETLSFYFEVNKKM